MEEYTLGSKVIVEEIEVKSNDKTDSGIYVPDSAKQKENYLKNLKEHPGQVKVVLAGQSAIEAGIKKDDVLYLRISARLEPVIIDKKVRYSITFSDILYGKRNS